MPAAALAATQAAPHPEPHRAAAGARPREGGLTVKVPLRLVVGAQYPDAALSTYVKIAALALRPEGCTAKVAVLADYLGMSKSAAERGLRALARPDAIDGLVEVPTVRRTLRGGRGQSAHRVVRPLTEGELWVRIPVRAAEALTPRLLRLYALLAYATARRIPVTAAELGEMLRHHTGQRAGEHLGERQARRLVDDLEGTGWLTVRRREGEQGRHAYETHRHPLHAVPAAPEAAALGEQAEQLPLWETGAPVVYDGSGPGDHDGSLASKEDHQTDRSNETQTVGGSRRRRSTGSRPATPASDLAGGTFGPGTSRAPRGTRTTPAPKPSYDAPDLCWTRRIHESVAPVRHLLDGANRFLLRKAAREIGRQLDDAARNLMTPERMAARITARYRDAATIRDVGAWLLTVAIVPKGCGQPLCEDGTVWPTGERCDTCAHQKQITSEQWRQARAWDERLAELRARRTAGTETEREAVEREQLERGQRVFAEALVHEQQDRAVAGAARARLLDAIGPDGVLPQKATYRQRSQATDEEVLAVAVEHGPAAALHRYGVLVAGPVLRAAYGALPELPARVGVMPSRPVPAGSPGRAIEETPMAERRDYMPPEVRAAINRDKAAEDLSRPCTQPGCLAGVGQACTSKQGRRRAPHTVRAAAPARGKES